MDGRPFARVCIEIRARTAILSTRIRARGIICPSAGRSFGGSCRGQAPCIVKSFHLVAIDSSAAVGQPQPRPRRLTELDRQSDHRGSLQPWRARPRDPTSGYPVCLRPETRRNAGRQREGTHLGSSVHHDRGAHDRGRAARMGNCGAMPSCARVATDSIQGGTMAGGRCRRLKGPGGPPVLQCLGFVCKQCNLRQVRWTVASQFRPPFKIEPA